MIGIEFKFIQLISAVAQLEQDKIDIVRSFEEKIEFLMANSKEEIIIYKRKLIEKTNELEHFKKDIVKEIKLKEILIKRHQEYEEIMK